MKKILVLITIIIIFFIKPVDSVINNNKIDKKKTIYNVENIKEKPNFGIIKIPKINLNRKFYNNGDIDKNIIMLPISDYPDTEKSLLVLAAHSGTGIAAYFNYLYKLELGDKVVINYNDNNIEYKIIDIYLQEKDGDVEIYKISNKRTLILITCTNYNKTKQTIYVATDI